MIIMIAMKLVIIMIAMMIKSGCWIDDVGEVGGRIRGGMGWVGVDQGAILHLFPGSAGYLFDLPKKWVSQKILNPARLKGLSSRFQW